MKRSRAVNPWTLATALACVLLVRSVVVAPPSHGDVTEAAYDAQARAVGIDATVTNESLPLGFVFQGIGPEANVRQTSFGQGDASASFPYAGDVVPTLPGVLAGVFGVPVPPYPFTVTSSSGQKPADVDFPGASLHAESGAASTVASAVIGSTASGASSLARIDEADNGCVTSTADVQYSILKLAQAVTLHGVHSHAEVTADAVTGKVARNTSLMIGRIHVPGLRFTIPKATPGQVPVPVPVPGFPTPPPIPAPPIPFPLGGETVEAPDIGFQNGTFTITLPFAGETQTFAVPADAVISAFRSAGVEMTFQAPQEIEAGVVAPVFSMKYAVPAPPDNQYFSGAVPVTYTLGGTLALANLNPASGGGVGASTDSAPVGGAAGDPVDGAGAPGAVPGADLAGLESVTDNQIPSSTVAGTPNGEFQLAQATAGPTGGGSIFGADLAALYLILFALAGLAFATVTAPRMLGAPRWNS